MLTEGNFKIEASDGSKVSAYFFSEEEPLEGEPCDKPEGLGVGVNPRTGCPILRSEDNLPNLDNLTHCPVCGNEEFNVGGVVGDDDTLGGPYSEYMIVCPVCGTTLFSSHWSKPLGG
ncbi:MAG: hypothetical protein R6U52_07625 [Kosmotogaceae bacterium]